MKITWIGHANVLLEGSKTIIIDPFTKDNPAAALQLDDIPKLDYVLVTHDHADHFGQAIELAKRDDATLVAIHEVTLRDDVVAAGVKTIGMNIGGTLTEDGVHMSMTPAVHSAFHGNPAGFVVAMEGQRVYHAGDTALFSDMKLIPELFGALDVALLPIGGHYTMDEAAAVRAVGLLQPAVTIPIHYHTWPPIEVDTQAFAAAAREYTNVVLLAPGESYEANRQ